MVLDVVAAAEVLLRLDEPGPRPQLLFAEPEKLVMTDSFADEHGQVVPATYYGMSPDFPLQLLITVTFEELKGNRTRLTLRHSGINGISAADREGMRQGWTESFDKLAQILG